MLVALIALGAVAWCAVGVSGFIYWWTTEYDLGVGEVVMAILFVSWGGPIAWLIGAGIHGQPKQQRVIMHKRS